MKIVNKNWVNRVEVTKVKLQNAAQIGQGILNGVVGDYLDTTENGLSIQMMFIKNGKGLALNHDELLNYDTHLSNRICILIHGLTSDETTWNYADGQENYGDLLQKNFGYTPFFLRYNTGKHISENGKTFSKLIETLIHNYPLDVEEIVVIGHSMGGLVLRSACYYAESDQLLWHKRLSKIIFLGTPHLGAPLEKFGNVLSYLLKKIPVSYSKISGDIINVRSAGIKDLRFGYLTDEDWKNKNPDELLKNNKVRVPLLDHVKYYIITGSIHKNPVHPVNEWFGDALVLKKSATGKGRNKHYIPFDLNNHSSFEGLTHNKLTHHHGVFEQINQWVSETNLSEKLPSENFKSTTSDLKRFEIESTQLINQSKMKGLLSLSRAVLKGGIIKLEELNESRISYKILNQIPLINFFSKSIEEQQVKYSGILLRNIKDLV